MPGVRGALQGVNRYKPDNISQEVWESWIVSYFYNHSMADPVIFNEWWYNKVRFEALDKLIVDKVQTPIRSEGRMARKPGIYPWGRPDIAGSLQTYGALHFGTEFGWQREWKDAPRGRKFGWAGNFILVVGMGREYGQYRRNFRIGGDNYEHWAMKDMLATVYALICEAERRGDMMTIIPTPCRWMADWDTFWYDNLTSNVPQEHMISKFFDRSGNAVTMGRKVSNVWQDNDRTEVNYGGGKIQEDGKGLSYNPMIEFWNYIINVDYDIHLRNVQGGWWHEPTRTPTSAMSDGEGEIGKPICVNSRDYDRIKQFFLKMPNFFSGELTSIESTVMYPQTALQYIQNHITDFSKTERTTVVIIGNTHYPQYMNLAWKTLETLKAKADVWFFDVGSSDHESYYFGEKAQEYHATRIVNGQDTHIPLMISGGKRLFHYVYVDNVANLTQIVLNSLRGRK